MRLGRSFRLLVSSLGACAAIVLPPMSLRLENVGISRDNSALASCVRRIAKYRFPRKERVPVLVPDFLDERDTGDSGLVRALFAALRAEVAVYALSEVSPDTETYEVSRSALLVLNNSTNVEMIPRLDKLCGPRCRFLLCLTRSFPTETDFLREARSVVEALWKFWISYAVVVAEADGRVVLAGSSGFKAFVDTVPEDPVILGDCDLVARSDSELVFRDMTLNRCLLNATAFDCPPYAIFGNGLLDPMSGIEGELLEAVADKINVSLNRVRMQYPSNGTNMHEALIYTLTDKDDTDVAFCGLYQGSVSTVEYSVPYDVLRVAWVVPARNSPNLSGLVKPFRNSVWLAVIGLFFFAWITGLFFFRDLSMLNVFSIILGVAVPSQPKISSRRIHFISCVVYGYVVAQYYLASLAGQLTNVNFQSIRTMEELEKSGLKLGGSPRYKELFEDPDGSRVVRQIYGKYESLGTSEYDERLLRLERGVDKSMALVAEIKVSHGVSHPGAEDPHQLEETLARYPLAFAVWKGAPFIDDINRRVSQLVETGFVQYWGEVYSSKSTNRAVAGETTTNRIDMIHLTANFFLLLLGLATSILVFLFEILVKWHENRSRRIESTSKCNKPERYIM